MMILFRFNKRIPYKNFRTVIYFLFTVILIRQKFVPLQLETKILILYVPYKYLW